MLSSRLISNRSRDPKDGRAYTFEEMQRFYKGAAWRVWCLKYGEIIGKPWENGGLSYGKLT